MQRIFFASMLIGCLAATVGAQAPPTTRPSSQPSIDPIADQVLRGTCDFLAQTKAFAVHAEIWKDEVLSSGHKIQVTRSIEMDVRRPNRLFVDQRAHRKGRTIWYDGKSVTVLDRAQNLYATANAPDSIDQLLDQLSDNYGITVPLEDLAVADPYENAIKHATAGGYFGDEPVFGVKCKHIGFSTDRIDWQLWVADGMQPLPKKLVITYKNEDQSPQYTAIFTKWELTGRASDLVFQFVPPHGAEQIPIIPQHTPEHSKAKP
jgi:hypothetical protein